MATKRKHPCFLALAQRNKKVDEWLPVSREISYCFEHRIEILL